MAQTTLFLCGRLLRNKSLFCFRFFEFQVWFVLGFFSSLSLRGVSRHEAKQSHKHNSILVCFELEVFFSSLSLWGTKSLINIIQFWFNFVLFWSFTFFQQFVTLRYEESHNQLKLKLNCSSKWLDDHKLIPISAPSPSERAGVRLYSNPLSFGEGWGEEKQ